MKEFYKNIIPDHIHSVHDKYTEQIIHLEKIPVSNLVMAIMADVGVTVLVILNSLRLLKYN